MRTSALPFWWWVMSGAAVALIAYLSSVVVRAWMLDRRGRKALKGFRTQMVTISPQFHTGGPLSPAIRAMAAGTTINQLFGSLTEDTEPVVLEETWSPEKIVAWRVIDVQVEEGDPDGLWLGFPHPDGPTEPVFTPVHHPVGVELHATCNAGDFLGYSFNRQECAESPGENCQSVVGYGCGFYAFKTRKQAATMAQGANNMFALRSQSLACVLLSGKVIEHEGGYRAEILEVVDFETPITIQETFGEISIGFSTATARMARLGFLSSQLRARSTNPFRYPSGGV